MLKGAHLPTVGVPVKQVDSVKYLGHFLTCELSDDIDIRRQRRVLNVVVIFYFVNFMCGVPAKLKHFNYYCSSLYTPHLWWNYKKMCVTKLQITYHIILKRNIGLSKYESTSGTCNFTNTQCCQSTIRNLVFKCVYRLNTSDNALIKALLASSVVCSILLTNSFPFEAVAICTRRIVVTD